jgi:hypothetical protein
MPGKPLCDWTREEMRRYRTELLQIILRANHTCRNCGRIANEPRFLCDPRPGCEHRKHDLAAA